MTAAATGMSLPRTYLYVPPEEKSEVQALGASWDADSKCWYVDADEASERFSRWLPEGDDDEFAIISSHAYVAAAPTSCQRCRAPIQVICIHCESGTARGDALKRFTISNVWLVDDALSRQLARWPQFRPVDAGREQSYYANHCSSCGAAQDDMLLHSEPDQPFFNIPRAARGTITLTPLDGTIQLSGDEHFEVD